MATTQDYARLLHKDLQEGKWRVVYVRNNPMTRQRELLRYCPLDNPRQTRDCLKALEIYGSSSNFPKKRHYVKDPVCDRVEDFSGLWRIIENRGAKGDESEGIYQTLREGWVTAFADSEWRISSVQGNYQDGTLVINRYTRNVDPEKLVALTATKKATNTETDPKIEGQTQTGTFASSGVTGQIMDEDGAGVITQVLRQQQTVSEATANALYGLRHRKTRDNQILQLFNFATGTKDAIAHVFRGLPPVQETTMMETITATTLLTAANLSSSGYSYAGRHWQVESDGTATLTIAYQKNTWNSWATDEEGALTRPTADEVYETFPEGIVDSVAPVTFKTNVFLNIDADDKDAAEDFLWTNPPTGWLHDDVRYRNNGDGSVDLIEQLTKVDLTYEEAWSSASGSYWTYTFFGDDINSSARYDRIWNYYKRYYENEADARAWIANTGVYGSGYGGSHVAKLASRVWRVIKQTKGTDVLSVGW